MNRLSKVLTLLVLLTPFAAGADVYVKGYTRSNGTYVDSYYRSSPDSTTSNNWSTQGNYNPYTGEAGHRSGSDSLSNSYYDNTTRTPSQLYPSGSLYNGSR